MSDSKGSMVGSVVVAQDWTGNFQCSGLDDQVEILLAINHANAIGVNHVSFKAGTYHINGLTIAQNVVLVGVEEGVVFNLPVQPSITVTTAVDYIVFERITFLSVLDDSDIIRFNPVKGTFRYCKFDLQLDTGGDDAVIWYVNDTDQSDIIFDNCELIGGKAGASGFGLFLTHSDLGSMTIKDFRIVNVTCDTTAGYARLWVSGDVSKTCDALYANNIIWEYLTAGGTSDSAFIYGTFRCTTAIVDGFFFLDGNLAAGHEIAPTGVFADHLQCSNFLLIGQRVHGYSGRITHQMNNIYYIGTQAYSAGWDLQTEGASAKYATVENCIFYDASIDINSQWKKVTFSNCIFLGSRLTFLDEGVKNQPREVTVSNCQWEYHENAPWDYAMLLGFDQGLYLRKLLISNCHIEGYNYTFQTSGTPRIVTDPPNFVHCPPHIIIDHLVTEPVIHDPNWPRLFDTGGRNHDDQTVWIFDSEITTRNPPLDAWNNIRPNDRFDNVKWINNAGSAVTYSERHGIASITGAVNVVDVNHVLVDGTATRYTLQIEALGNAMGAYYVSSKDQAGTQTDFRITFANQPAASTWYFDWNAWMMR